MEANISTAERQLGAHEGARANLPWSATRSAIVYRTAHGTQLLTNSAAVCAVCLQGRSLRPTVQLLDQGRA